MSLRQVLPGGFLIFPVAATEFKWQDQLLVQHQQWLRLFRKLFAERTVVIIATPSCAENCRGENYICSVDSLYTSGQCSSSNHNVSPTTRIILTDVAEDSGDACSPCRQMLIYSVKILELSCCAVVVLVLGCRVAESFATRTHQSHAARLSDAFATVA